VFSTLTVVIIIGTLVLAVLYSIDWTALAPSVLALVLMLGFLYWTTTLLPGPVKKLGRAAGRQVMKSMRTKRKP
jgi:hypothetical protein